MAKRVKRTIICTILVCIITIVVKNQYSYVLLRNATYGIPKLIDKGYISELYIGSSMFRQGLDILVLKEANEDRYILSYNGNQPFSEYYQLRYLLEHDVQIQKIYIDMYVYSAWENPKISDEKIFLEVGIVEKYNLWKHIKDYSKSPVEMFWRMFVNGNNELLLTWPLMSPILNSQFYNGGTLRETGMTNYEGLQQMPVVELGSEMNVIQKEYLNKIIDLANSNNISVVFVETPKFETVACNDSYINAMNEYVEVLDNKQVTYVLSELTAKHLDIGTTDTYRFDNSKDKYFLDTIHLSSEGRREFSKVLNCVTE